jgi:hypothetical protein
MNRRNFKAIIHEAVQRFGVMTMDGEHNEISELKINEWLDRNYPEENKTNMKIIKPTSDDQNPKEGSIRIFLAGSIEMGAAEDWQTALTDRSEHLNVTFYNPRREEWDSSWTQEQKSPQFNYQVNWELDMLDDADLIFMYFSPGTKSPISLMELGAYGSSNKMIVCCPEGFWRRGNVEIFCTRHNIPFFSNLDDAIGGLATKVHLQQRYNKVRW